MNRSWYGVATGAGVGVGAGLPAAAEPVSGEASGNVTHDDELLVGNPQNVRAHAFRDHADRNENVTLIHDRRNVQRTRFAVDDDLRLTDGNFNVGSRFGYVNGLARRVVRNGRAHLLEHRAQGDEQGSALDQSRENSALLEDVGFAIYVVVVVKNRNLA